MDSSRSSNNSSSDSSSSDSDSNSNSSGSTLEFLEIVLVSLVDGMDFEFVTPAPYPDDLPFTNDEISSIETVSVSGADVREEKGCGICLLDYNVGEELRKVPCGGEHLFHEECLFTWLQTKKTCPMCREQLKLDENDPSQDRRHSI